MNYEKLSPEKFSEKLKNSEYQDVTGARRAIGKASWPEAAKATARTQAEKFFGTGGLNKAKAKAEKPAKANKVKATIAQAQAVEKPAKGKKQVKQKKVQAQPAAEPAHHASPGNRPLTAADIRKNPFQVIQLAEHCVASGTGVLNAATAMKAADALVDVSDLTKDAVATIRHGLELASRVITNLADGMDLPKSINTAAANGAIHSEDPVPGEAVYSAPIAEA